ncbi:mannosyl-oligosaccharide 1-2-alpha-mannosidase [Fragilaria crotonensis]|nr:mannosyl-oligosaccharide 1-2-alpha-mannosidase [Fragilaria crotonensis]
MITGLGRLVTFIALSILLVAVDGTLDLPPRHPNCRSIQPIQFPSADFDQKDRFLAVQAAIHHAWKGYKDMQSRTQNSFSTTKSEWPDDLMPLSQRGNTWLHASATLYDSLDTLYLAGLDNDFDDALNMVLRSSMTSSTTPAAFSLRPTKTFEYSIRVVGGLLGAYSVSGNPKLLALAIRAADALLEGPFAASPTVLPRPFAVLAPPSYYTHFWYGSSSSTTANTVPSRWEIMRCCGLSISFWWQGIGRILQRLWGLLYSIGRDAMGEHHYNSLAGVGSFALEFEFLSMQTTAPRYRDAANAIFYHVTAKSKATSMLSSNWNVMTGSPTFGSSRTLGSGSDSFYEYLLKVALLKDKDDPLRNDYMDLYVNVVDEALLSNRRLVFEAHGHDYPTEGYDRYHHLLCFVPGMLALGESQGVFAGSAYTHNDENGAVLTLARNLADGCYDTYARTETGLGPEAISIATDRSTDAGYYLRPEFVESLFVLYRTTGEVRYREMAWQVFQSIEKHCKVDHGYASLKDVNDPSSHLDDMPSFFIGETLKYLLLTFAPEDYVSLDDFVFTTEAHPLHKGAAIDDLPACYDLQLLLNPPIPILLVVGSNIVALFACVCCLWFFAFKKRNSRDKNRVKLL